MRTGYSAEEQHALWDEFWGALCSVGIVGDMYTSGSPYDPTFWLIHPTVDRCAVNCVNRVIFNILSQTCALQASANRVCFRCYVGF
jgi:hypothetical protein